jgi:phosphatidylglycerol:prolipoprotein diacylglycerol transferase
MCQTLFYIPSEVFGFPVFGFGLAFVLLAVIVMIIAAWHFVKTKKFDEDIGSYLGLFVIGGIVLIFVVPNVLEPEHGFPVRGYGVCLLAAILSALVLVLKLAKRKNIPSEQLFSLCLWAVVGGILGARLFYVVEYWPEMVQYENGKLQPGVTLFNLVNIANGGLVVYGSILGGILGSLIFMIRNKMPVGATFDSMAPAMMLGIAIGRVGCLLNGCCYGGVTDWAWGIVFPAGSPAHIHQIEHNEIFYYGLKFEEYKINGQPILAIDSIQPNSGAELAGLKPKMWLRNIGGIINGKPFFWEVQTKMDTFRVISHLQTQSPNENIRFDIYSDTAKTETKPFFVAPTPSAVLPVHPTQIYSSITALFLCGVLIMLGRLRFFRSRDGLVFATFLILYSVARFCIEMIRTDEDSFFGTGLTISQNICIAVFFAGIVLLSVLSKKPRTLNRNGKKGT